MTMLMMMVSIDFNKVSPFHIFHSQHGVYSDEWKTSDTCVDKYVCVSFPVLCTTFGYINILAICINVLAVCMLLGMITQVVKQVALLLRHFSASSFS